MAALVVGDIIVDVYKCVRSTRIAREALVPVCVESRCDRSLGGAALCALNLASLGVSVTMAGFVGDDENGRWAISEFGRVGVDMSSVVICSGWTTPSITRLSGEVGGVISRLDSEVLPVSEKDVTNLMSVVNTPDLVVASEYCKGTLSARVTRWLHSFDAPLLVDPRYAPERFAGAHTVKMNHTEFGDVPTVAVLKAFAIKHNLARIIVTLAGDGLVGYDRRTDEFISSPGKRVKVYDVTGAGDVVHATLSFLTLKGQRFDEICRVSEAMGRYSVQTPGTVVIEKTDLAREIDPTVSLELFCECVSRHCVVFTCGCFDVFHHGHLDSLRTAKAEGDFLVVGVNSDASVRRLKGDSRPLNPEWFRQWVVEQVPGVDRVIIFGEDTPELLMAMLKPDVFVKGSEYDADALPGVHHVGRVKLLPMTPRVSTTRILEAWMPAEKPRHVGGKALFFGHLGFGDAFLQDGLVRHLRTVHDYVYVVTKHPRLMEILYRDALDRIEILPVEDRPGLSAAVRRFCAAKNIKFYGSGLHSLSKIPRDHCFPDVLYETVGIPVETMYSMAAIPITPPPVDIQQPYIFVHDVSSSHSLPISEAVLKVFPDALLINPDRNVYPPGAKHHALAEKAVRTKSTNITDYTSLVRNASKLFMVDSSLWCLAEVTGANPEVAMLFARMTHRSRYFSIHAIPENPTPDAFAEQIKRVSNQT